MRVSELKVGIQMDTLVAMAQDYIIEDDGGFKRVIGYRAGYWIDKPHPAWQACWSKYDPSSGTIQTYELMEKFIFQLYQEDDTPALWVADNESYYGACGETMAEAVCKAVISSKWGGKIPDEIWEKVAPPISIIGSK